MRRKTALLISVSVFVSFASTVFATDRLVPSQYATIQAAIDAAIASDTVIIADGTYTGTGNKNLDFAGKAITVRSENGPDACIIDCQNSGRGFYFHTGETATSIISGLTIKNGRVTGNPATGGGIYCTGTSPTIENCILTNNVAQGDDGACGDSGSSGKNGFGGGIYCTSNSHPVIIDCEISSNQARGGLGGYTSFPPPSTNLCFGHDGGTTHGGGIYCSSDSSVTVNRCSINNNTASGGNGRECTERGNGGYAAGGGIYCSDTLASAISDSNISSNLVQGGTGMTPGECDGGGIFGYVSLTNSLLVSNTLNSPIALMNRGAAIYSKGSSPLIKNCTIANHATWQDGPAVLCISTTTIRNCILWNNNSYDLGSNYAVTYSCTQQNITGTGNIYSDPLFVSGPQGNYYLSQIAAGQATNSPCVNTGTGTAASHGLDDFTTRSDQFHDKGTVDMGYHYSITPGSADIMQNLHVDFTDYAVLATDWLLCNPSNWFNGDIDKDECVNENDLGLLAQAWLDCYVGTASNPSPTDNATDVVRDPVLSWTGGTGALHHDIYLGTNLADVTNADISSSVYCGRQDSVSWDSNSIYPSGLALDTIYYWRIDEVGSACTKKGNIWNFRVAEGGAASNSTPSDKAVAVDLNTVLKWSPDPYAISHDVYFGTESADVNTATVPLTTTDVNSYNPGPLNLATTYYWRIDEFDGFTTHHGSLWSFTTRSALDQTLVGWWKLDETEGITAHDSSDYSNNGSLNGNPVWATGQIDGALAFDAVDDIIDCGNSTSLVITNNITISSWIRYNQLNAGTILAKGYDNQFQVNYSFGTGGGGGFGASDELLFSYMGSSSWHAYETSNANLATGQWYHVAVTFTFGTGSSIKCYLNGNLLAGSWDYNNGNAAPVTSIKPLTIGACPYGRRMNGTLDDVRIYNRVLSAAEILTLYGQGLGGKAFNPNPSSGAANIDIVATLSWSPNQTAVSHDVYLSTSFADVNDGTIPLDTTDVNSYDPGGLDYSTTYYWRIDEFDGTDTHKGDIWSFTTMAGKASAPNPSNGASGYGTNVTLSWSTAPYATSHDVYFGTSSADVNSSTTPVATTGTASYNPDTLNYTTTYYWRIDEDDGTVTIKGDIWNFTTCPLLDPNLGLVGWWKLDETSGTTASDSALTNHGTLYGNPVWMPGQIDGSLDCDTSGDYVRIPDNASLNPAQQITIAFWIYARTAGGGIYKYASCPSSGGSPGNSRAYYAIIGTNAQLVIYSAVNTSDSLTSIGTVSLNQWQHIAATFNQGLAKIYINGQLDNTKTMSVSSIMNDAQPVTFGGYWQYCTPTFVQTLNGMLDDVRIYNRALNNGEVQQLYEAGLP